jgi:4-hydroxybenzoate polyprenyltransferase
MAFAAVQNHVPMLARDIMLANVFWSDAYDTEYSMVDRDDDIRIGIRTSALTFGRFVVAAIMLCYAATLGIYVGIGVMLGFGVLYWLGWAAAAGCAIYHYTLIRHRERMPCFKAFLHNNWLGGALFVGIAAHYAVASF